MPCRRAAWRLIDLLIAQSNLERARGCWLKNMHSPRTNLINRSVKCMLITR